MEALERCRKITREQVDKHPNPDFKIHVMPDEDIFFTWVMELVNWMRISDVEDRKIVMLMPNPVPEYRHVAAMINKFRINCRNVWMFALDEYANEKGEIAPDTWDNSFMYSLRNFLWKNIDEDLRMPAEQVIGPTDQNINDYTNMIEQEGNGGADISYTGPGWVGHVGFVEPDAPEFAGTLEEFKQMGARICTLSPFTLAQNSLHGCFGMSGDIARVPPMAATIGPRDVINARNRIEVHSIGIHGTATTWQRLMSRLCCHGPVCPQLPTSIHQELRTDVLMSETIAATIEDTWAKGY
jgi:glucosamine-6-phosphate deaminase